MKKVLFIITVLLGSIGMFAQPRSEEQAKQIASEFFKKKPQQKAPMLSVVPQQKVSQTINKKMARGKATPAQHSACYIINDEANNRFVIVSADERMHRILGYSDYSLFDANNLPDGLIDLFYDWNLSYHYLDSIDLQVQFTNNVTTDPVEPLIKTHWHQGNPYNNKCPENIGLADGSICAGGCVALAMAQIMKYHEYPQNGSYSWNYYTRSQNFHEQFNFERLNVNWGNIIDLYDDQSSEEQKDEVAKLIYACGVSVSMDYGDKDSKGNVTSSSGAYSFDVPHAFIKYFNYNPNVTYKMRDYYSDYEWNAILLNELRSGRPVYYSGSDFWSGGHAFIVDGCNGEGLYHINWGWGWELYLGMEHTLDGYYALDALRPVETWGSTVLRERNYTFSLNQAMVCNIAPTICGTYEDTFYATSFNMTGSKTKKIGSSTNFYCWPICYSNKTTLAGDDDDKFNGVIGIGLYDIDFNFIKPLYSTQLSTKKQSCTIDSDITFDASTYYSGSQFIIAPFAKSDAATIPSRIRAKNGQTNYYLVECDNNQTITLTPNGIVIPRPIVAGDYHVTAKSNFSENELLWNVNIWQDNDEVNKYWITNLDSIVSKKGYTCESGWNKIYGIINDTHTQLSIPVNQEIGKDIIIKNISGGDNITIQLTEIDGKMYFSSINDIWGSKELSADNEMSRYQYTTIAYGKIDPTPDPVETPSIDVSLNNHSFTIHHAENVTVLYTMDKSVSLKDNGTPYNDTPVKLNHNCTIRAIAYDTNGNWSDETNQVVSFFKVETPEIIQDENDLNHYSFICATDGATTYYDWDGKTRQTGSLVITKSGVIKVYAEKDNFNPSDVREQSLEFIPDPDPDPDPSILVISNNEAGKLPTRISDAEKLSATRLTISGYINGTDIIFIRKMFYDGKLTDLDIENSTIVSGGDIYDTSINAVTNDNVVGKYFFENCKQMVSIKLPSNAIKIENNAFDGCKSLKKLDIPGSCVEVEDFVIKGCDNIEEVNLSDAVQIFPSLAIYSCNNLKSLNTGKGNSYFTSIDGVLYSKDGETLIRYPEGKDDTSFVIPNSVVTIGKDAFDNAKIENITIPNSVKTIESSAFENCKNLQSVSIPNSVSTIGKSAFKYCERLDNVTISSEVSSIESFTFSGCKNLRKFYIGTQLSNIDKLAFYDCPSLQEFEVSEDSKYFTSSSGILYTKDMSELVKCPMALYAEEYIVPNGVKVIRAEAFASCKNIKSFYLPETLTTIGECAFENCEMSLVRIPQTVTSIGESAFNNCKNLETFVFPEGISKIENNTLHGCKSLSYVYIPESVKSFGYWTIADCPSLTMINCQITDIDKVIIHYDSYDAYYDAFEKIPANCTWRVPFGPENDIDKYARKYMQQPWWISTWTIIPKVTSDVNSDGHIDIADAVTVLNAMAGEDVVGNADVNGDGIVDIADFVIVLNIMAGE